MIKTILCFGCSITNGARDEYGRNYPMELTQIIQYKLNKFIYCINKGINRETTSDMLNRAYDVFRSNKDSDLLLFMGGTNDSKIPIPLDIFKNNIETIIKLAFSLDMKPYIGLLPQVTGNSCPNYSQKIGNQFIYKYNKILIEICNEVNVKYVDFSKLDRKYFPDGIHLNHAGDLKMAGIWFDNIKGELE